MKKILFATEFSDHAKHIFEYAIELAFRFKAELIAVHSYNTSDIKTAEEQDFNIHANRMMNSLNAFLVAHTPGYCDGKVPIRKVVELGFAAEVIQSVAEEEEVDLIVMGMKGKRNSIDRMLGSVTTEVLLKSNCPVLIVPETSKFSLFDTLVYANDYEFRDLAAIDQVMEWADTLSSKLHCLHVFEKDEKEKLVKRNTEILYRIFRKHKKQIDFEILKGELEKTILDYCAENDVDILIMASHPRNLVKRLLEKNTSVRVAQKINVPMLILKLD